MTASVLQVYMFGDLFYRCILFVCSNISAHVFLCPHILCVCRCLYACLHLYFSFKPVVCVYVCVRVHVCVSLLSQHDRSQWKCFFFATLDVCLHLFFFLPLSHPPFWFPLCLDTVNLIYIHSQAECPRSPAFVQRVALTETSDAMCDSFWVTVSLSLSFSLFLSCSLLADELCHQQYACYCLIWIYLFLLL